jgi:branched-chain amino acid transport system permease protein
VHSTGQWFLQLAIGISFGLLLFLLASGFTLTFGLARFVNLAHGAVFLVAAYVATSASEAGAPFPVAVLAATATGLALSMLTYAVARLRWRRIEADVLAQVLLTFGLLLVLADFARSHWGGVPRSVPTPTPLDGSIPMGDAALPVYRLFMIGAALVVALGLWWLQDRTIFGALVRAGVDDRQMLEATGVRAAPLFVAVFALAGALAGLAAGLGTPVLGATMGQEFDVLVLALVIVVLGGAGSLRGAFVASLAVGLVDAFGKALIPTFAGFSMMALVVIVLAWRPNGLLAAASR